MALFVAAIPLAACGGEAKVNYTLSEDGTHYIVSGVSGNANALNSYVVPSEYAEDEGGELLPVTEIGREAFMGCTSLYNITLPEGIERIGVRAFMTCGFRTFTIPQSVTSIGYGAFGKCDSLEKIVIPEAVTEIEPYAFAFCSRLEKVEIYGAITELESCVFTNLYASMAGNLFTESSLKEITIPATVKKIHISALDGNLLKDIYFAGSKEQWDELYFYDYEKVEGKEGEEDDYVEKKVEKSNVLKGVEIHCGGKTDLIKRRRKSAPL